MNNYVQKGETITYTVAGADVVSGQGLLVGALFGICATSQVVGEDVELALVGVYRLPKKSADVAAQFALAYWDDTNQEVTTTSDSNTLIGAFALDAAAGEIEATVRLDGTAK